MRIEPRPTTAQHCHTARLELRVTAVLTGAGFAAVLLFLVVVALWAAGGNGGSMSYYQREVDRMMRKQSRQEKASLEARTRRNRRQRWRSRVHPAQACRRKHEHET